MKIYTKAGDGGKTSLFGGKKVSKSAPRIAAYGTVDELNSTIGAVRSCGLERRLDAFLERVQSDLFRVGAELASPGGDAPGSPGPVGGADVSFMEGEIDRLDADLEPLRNFILPGGTPAASAAHIARSVCRRAERTVVELSERETVRGEVVVYLNRLSDALFVAARWINAAAGAPERPWKPSK
ncbi:MAG TPA: cob(I)yrinic acid a,c-diamide adenosyltransferase [Bacteroidota bacterium]|nr:cob(I)yrinic acid a,c-diamide adenosyltransferase [Bacteroidota bacterium]